MQKVINPNHLDSYFSVGDYSGSVAGSLAKFSDVQHLKTYADIYNGLRLDYGGTPFTPPGANKNSVMYAIRFTSNETESKVVHSVKDILEPVLDDFALNSPYTGNGFISSADSLDLTKIPGKPLNEGNKLIPEYYGLGTGTDAIRLNDGAEMYKITETGEEILYAIFNKDNGFFKKIGE